ncbi:MAG: tetratricopeptide repeat protein, partial [Candidatus Micrarchaeota archaeon]|nr:tetratricopeptide repeat protein [Candidatus Micrarchaeota archaeon]
LSSCASVAREKREGFLNLAKGNLDEGLVKVSESIAKRGDLGILNLLETGYIELESNNYNVALDAFSKAILINPFSTVPYFARGKMHLKYGEYEKARQDFETILGIEDSAQARLCMGTCYTGLGKSTDALIEFSLAISASPKYSEAYAARGMLYLRLNEFEKALNDIENAIKFDNKNLSHFFTKGQILLRMGRAEEALESFNHVCEKAGKKNFPDAFYGKGVALNHLKRYKEALESLNIAIKYNGKNHNIYHERYNVLLSLGDSNGALGDYQRYTELKAANELGAYRESAISLLGKSMFDAALECICNAIALDPNDAELHNLKGTILFSMENNEEAVNEYSKAISLNGKDPSYYSNRSMASYNLGKYADSLRDAEAAMRILPRNVQLYYGKAQALIAMERHDEAITELTKAIRRDACNDVLFFERGTCFFNQGRFRQSIRDFRTAIALDPENPIYYNDLGYTFYSMLKFEDAISYYKKAIAHSSEEDKFILSLANSNIAICLDELGKHGDAMAHYDKAIGIMPSNARYYMYRGELKKRMGDIHGAQHDFDRALDLENPEDEE